MDTTISNKSTALQTVLLGAGHYRRHPELMLPFLIQGALGVALTWLTLSVPEPIADGPMLIALVPLTLLSFVLQLWGIRWTGETLSSEASMRGAFKLALRRGLRAFGLTLAAVLPGSALLFVFVEATTDVLQEIGLAFSFALIYWLIFLGFIGILDANQKIFRALREALLMLAVSPTTMLTWLGVLCAYGYLDLTLSGSLVVVGFDTLEPGDLGVWGSVAWFVFNILWQPLMFICLTLFHRQHRTLQRDQADEKPSAEAASCRSAKPDVERRPG